MRCFAFYPAAWTALFLLFVFRAVPLPLLLGLVCVVWVSVAVHELGHVAAAILAGGRVTGIRIHPWHGRTTYRNCGNLQGIAVALAGPAAGFLSAAAAHHLFAPTMTDPSLLAFGSAVRFVLNACMLDNVLNLTPVWLLDGRAFLRHFNDWRRERRIRAVLARARALGVLPAEPSPHLSLVESKPLAGGRTDVDSAGPRGEARFNTHEVEEPSTLVASI